MPHNAEVPSETSITYAVEGLPDHHEVPVPNSATAAEILALIKSRHPDIEIVELLVEDEEKVCGNDIVERVEVEFKLLHAARGGTIHVKVKYETTQKEKGFKPSATVRSIIEWAVSKDGFDLLEGPAKFVLKLQDRVLEPELHLGQLTHGSREVEFTLVHGRKIQG